MPSTDPVSAAVAACLRAQGAGLYGIACSGGADSMALAHAAMSVAGATHVVALTVDHGLVDGSETRTAEVGAWARGQGSAAMSRRVEVRPDGHGLEAAARDARYAALDAMADAVGACCVLVAHTRRDQAETVLLRIVRGTGPAGLAGIPMRRGRFVRPLLEVARAEVETYVARHGLPTWHDPMNDDPRFARVRMRKRLFEYRTENPRIEEALARLAASAVEWTEVIDTLADPFARLPIDCAALSQQPAAVRKRALALAIPGTPAILLDRLDRLVMAPSRGTVTLDVPGGRLQRCYDVLDVARDIESTALADGERVWRPGDRMRTRAGTRKLSDLFIDRKIPRNLRRTARVRVVDGEIVWAEHLGDAFR